MVISGHLRVIFGLKTANFAQKKTKMMIELHLLLFTSEYLQKSRSELENENGYEQDKYSYSESNLHNLK